MVLAKDAEHAAIVIEVTNRTITSAQDAGAVAFPIGTTTMIVPTREQIKVLTATLRFGALSRDLRSARSSTRLSVAASISEQVETFVKDNETKIRAQFEKK